MKSNSVSTSSLIDIAISRDSRSICMTVTGHVYLPQKLHMAYYLSGSNTEYLLGPKVTCRKILTQKLHEVYSVNTFVPTLHTTLCHNQEGQQLIFTYETS